MASEPIDIYWHHKNHPESLNLHVECGGGGVGAASLLRIFIKNVY